MFRITTRTLDGLPKTGESDPIEYYRRPLLGRLFLDRINRGLGLLPDRRYRRSLEVGYGAGAVQIALSTGVDERHGIDLDADPVPIESFLTARGFASRLVRGDVCELPYASESFDLVVCFSVFEHLHDYRKALGEVRRVLMPGGLFLLGMPAVNKLMDMAFYAIGFHGIEHHHVTTPKDVTGAFAAAGLHLRATRFLDLPARPPFGFRLYSNWLLERR